ERCWRGRGEGGGLGGVGMGGGIVWVGNERGVDAAAAAAGQAVSQFQVLVMRADDERVHAVAAVDPGVRREEQRSRRRAVHFDIVPPFAGVDGQVADIVVQDTDKKLAGE